MNHDAEVLASRFTREYTHSFKSDYLMRIINSLGFKVNAREVDDYLSANSNVFRLEDENYLTRAGVFTGRVFSFKPTLSEIRQRMVVLGSRCMPYVDSEQFPYFLSIVYGMKKLKPVKGVFDSDEAIDIFIGFGEEVSAQVINYDPANSDYEGESYELHDKTYLSGFDIGFLIDKYDFKYGDSITLKVKNWSKGILSLVLPSRRELKSLPRTYYSIAEEASLNLWYSDFENDLLDSFEKVGPLSSIDRQLVVNYVMHYKELSFGIAGNLNDFISQHASKVGIGYYGVESRLWYKDQDIPAVGNWNRNAVVTDKNCNPAMKDCSFQIPEFVIDEYIKDMYFHRKNNLKDLSDAIFTNEMDFTSMMRKKLLLNLEQRNSILEEKYNWFNDQVLGTVREKALDLYGRVILLLHEIDYSKCSLRELPQREFVILSQIHDHLMVIIRGFNENSYSDEDLIPLKSALEGMSLTFEDLKWPLKRNIEVQNRSLFRVEKKLGEN